MQQDNDPKLTVITTKDFIRKKNVLDWSSQSSDPNDYSYPKMEETPPKKQQLKDDVAWEGIAKEESGQ